MGLLAAWLLRGEHAADKVEHWDQSNFDIPFEERLLSRYGLMELEGSAELFARERPDPNAEEPEPQFSE